MKLFFVSTLIINSFSNNRHQADVIARPTKSSESTGIPKDSLSHLCVLSKYRYFARPSNRYKIINARLIYRNDECFWSIVADSSCFVSVVVSLDSRSLWSSFYGRTNINEMMRITIYNGKHTIIRECSRN